MKITFTKLATTKPQVEVKADAYKFAYYNVNTARTSGIVLNPKVFTDLDTIKIGSSKTKPAFTNEIKESFAVLVRNAEFTHSSNELESYLASLPDNTIDTPYKVILSDITTVAKTALKKYLKKYVELEFSDSVTNLGNSAFGFCTNLTSVTIPNSVTSIGHYAFDECTNLTTINYTGTEEQWNAITKSEDWNSMVPSTCVINYNYQS